MTRLIVPLPLLLPASFHSPPIIVKPDPQQSWAESKCLNRISSDKAGKWLTNTEISDISQHTPRKPIEYSSVQAVSLQVRLWLFHTPGSLYLVYLTYSPARDWNTRNCPAAYAVCACHCKAAAAPTLCILPKNMLTFPVHHLPWPNCSQQQILRHRRPNTSSGRSIPPNLRPAGRRSRRYVTAAIPV